MDIESMNRTLAVILAGTAAVIAAKRYRKKYLMKMPYHNEANKGAIETQRIICVSDTTCRDQIRMTRSCFRSLCAMVRRKGLLSDSRYLQVEEQLCMCLNTIGYNHKNRVVGHNFGHSGETVSRYINLALNAIVQLWLDLMKPPSMVTHHRISDNPRKFLPYFKDCVGAIDGTHIHAWVPVAQHGKFHDRHGNISQNILAACDFNMKFTYVLAGWEGSASDSTILDSAWHKIGEAKLRVTRGKFYLVDAGFPNQPGYLRPYHSVRYHLKEWENSELAPANVNELFNLRHSQLRNVIERAFGVLQKRFKIMKTQPEYPYKTQVKIANVCFFVHNHILNHNSFEKEERILDEEEIAYRAANPQDSMPPTVEPADDDNDDDDNENMENFRDVMAASMWNAYHIGGEGDESSDESI